MTGEIRHLTIERHARYAVLPGDPDRVTEVWFALHGYNQLAHRFMRRFLILDDGTRHIVAAEGLHRQYIDHATRKVGASWMTSEDRLTDIADYVAYLDRLYEAALAEIGRDRDEVRAVAVGFSQGVHTLCRWIALGASRIDRAVLWGGTVPPDLDLDRHGTALGRADLQLVVGDEDEYFGAAVVGKHEARLEAADVSFRSWSFEGGHTLHDQTLAAIAALPAG
ncbi:MAG: phospholipase [Gemmatimonadota bacterium]|nr:phospholipase [Gemmatimonadota bacterium]